MWLERLLDINHTTRDYTSLAVVANYPIIVLYGVNTFNNFNIQKV